MYSLYKSIGVPGKTNCFILAVILLIGLGAYGYGTGRIDSSQMLSDSEAAGLAGGMQWGACGILFGLGIGVLALGVAGISIGLASAAVISVGAHIAAAICID
ncbi:MAG: hypothetical protein ABSH28_11075 [Acidobacteriota bacterium]|jgi:hypothetical protein